MCVCVLCEKDTTNAAWAWIEGASWIEGPCIASASASAIRTIHATPPQPQPQHQSRCHAQGKKACHTGYRRTAGWVVPIGYLVEENIVSFRLQAAPHVLLRVAALEQAAQRWMCLLVCHLRPQPAATP